MKFNEEKHVAAPIFLNSIDFCSIWFESIIISEKIPFDDFEIDFQNENQKSVETEIQQTINYHNFKYNEKA